MKSALIAMAVAAFVLSGCDKNRRLCEDAIKKTLKAPATYKRVSSQGSDWFYNITYDAQNSYGVPLRGSGSCFIDKSGNANWLEDQKPDD